MTGMIAQNKDNCNFAIPNATKERNDKTSKAQP